ncbi:hypothetical protein ACM66B_000522 [Microbotryomycetes sp. NB124-2]
MSSINNALSRLSELSEGKIDYVGQDKSEQYMRRILYYTGIASFLVGFCLQSLKTGCIVFAIGFIACCLIVVPPHSIYNNNPVKWLSPLDEFGEPTMASTSTTTRAGGKLKPT